MSSHAHLLAMHPRRILPHLPRALAQPLVNLPFIVQGPVLRKALEHWLAEPLRQGDFDILKGRYLHLEISDLKRRWVFTCGPQRQIIVLPEGPEDVCIRSELQSFILLAAKKEDPDTLFFQRQLVIEGDTDLGLEIKNLLDGLELNALPPELLFLLKAQAEFVSIFRERG